MFAAAGCMFVSNQHVLAGYQPHKKTPIITGFGGKRNNGEEPLTTAWRETLEELMGWSEVPFDITEKGMNEIPIKSMEEKGYVQVVYSFESLETVLKEITKASPLYPVPPRSVGELVFNRKQGIQTEVPTLCVLPLEGQLVANHFIKDIQDFLCETSDGLPPSLVEANRVGFQNGQRPTGTTLSENPGRVDKLGKSINIQDFLGRHSRKVCHGVFDEGPLFEED